MSYFFFSSRRRHTRLQGDWSSDVCSSDLAARRKLSTDQVTTTVRQAIERRPTSVRGEPLTLQSAVQVAVAPPTFALKVNRPEEIHFSYERYLVRSLRLAFGFTGSPIRLSLRRASTSRPRRGVRR